MEETKGPRIGNQPEPVDADQQMVPENERRSRDEDSDSHDADKRQEPNSVNPPLNKQDFPFQHDQSASSNLA